MYRGDVYITQTLVFPCVQTYRGSVRVLSFEVLAMGQCKASRTVLVLVLLSRCSPISKESTRAQRNHRSVLSFLERGLEAILQNSKIHGVRLDRCLEADLS
ncbi:hypothetical protein CY34DRAFT_724110 [Suillus luteus UH-Slu-Lm8-n1]|uniref:Uncharacterized protein n=1 Tax=Suillus luteus UH-Slu-Lm8-n1 TaxID=930992 RepID=A0A0D0BIZ3_9AGAM|nr:hypothetical protein CY34DRAFT_724110 [Suillus luteus UH-Slu-Lm8-n1]